MQRGNTPCVPSQPTPCRPSTCPGVRTPSGSASHRRRIAATNSGSAGRVASTAARTDDPSRAATVRILTEPESHAPKRDRRQCHASVPVSASGSVVSARADEPVVVDELSTSTTMTSRPKPGEQPPRSHHEARGGSRRPACSSRSCVAVPRRLPAASLLAGCTIPAFVRAVPACAAAAARSRCGSRSASRCRGQLHSSTRTVGRNATWFLIRRASGEGCG